MPTTPWGSWEVLLDASYCKVKKIMVKPGQRTSLQKHFRREELWTVVQGEATVTLENRKRVIAKGESIHVPQETAHRIGNDGKEDMILIEIQRGAYFGEDDILRLEDDYGRS